MTDPLMSCDAVRPILFATLEPDGMSASERRAAAAHVAACEACRRALEEERALSALLGMPAFGDAGRSVARVPAARVPAALRVAVGLLVAAGVGAVLFVAAHRSPVFGDVRTDALAASPSPDASMRFDEVGRVEPLADSNHLDVPAGVRRTILVRGTGVVRVTGPASLDLDRAPEGWKVALLRGQIEAEVEPGAALRVTSALGERTLAAGRHAIALDAASFEPVEEDGAAASDEEPPTPARLVEEALRLFAEGTDMASAERGFRDAIAHADASDEQKCLALFYLAGALSRQGKTVEAIDVQEEYLRLYPEADGRAYTLYFLGVHHERLGELDRSRERFAQLAEEFPDSELTALAQRRGNAAAPPATTPSEGAKESGRVLPADAGAPGPYVVVAVALGASDAEDRAFRAVAEKVVAHRRGTLVDFDGEDFGALEERLAGLDPENVLFVVRPARLDVALHRQVLLLSARLDEDAFPDFAFGYFTARDGKALEKLWSRTLETEKKGLSGTKWVGTAVASSIPSTVYENSGLPIAKAAGFAGPSLYWSCVETDPRVMDFVERKISELETASVITMTGNGDPEGIWLFDDHRNVDRAKWWKFDPKKVGQDPKGEMPRITAEKFRKLKLARPVVWSGTCHSAAVGRVFVEGDIVSTFGETGDSCVAYSMPPERGLALAILDAGAVALLAPIAANHGLAVDREVEFALENGASLGETVKSTYDDVFLACGGKLVLEIPVDGERRRDDGEIMQGGGANRILVGDPALRPFARTKHPLESVATTPLTPGGFTAVVEHAKGFHARDWDMYGADRSRDWRVMARVPLEGLVTAGRALAFDATVRAVDLETGRELPYAVTRVEPEAYHGRRFLHLQANAPRAAVSEAAPRATFTVTTSAPE